MVDTLLLAIKRMAWCSRVLHNLDTSNNLGLTGHLGNVDTLASMITLVMAGPMRDSEEVMVTSLDALNFALIVMLDILNKVVVVKGPDMEFQQEGVRSMT